MKSNYLFLYSYLFLVVFTSCKKFVDIPPPPTELVGQDAFNSDPSATAALVGIYSNMMSTTGFASGGPQSITQLTGASADEFINYSTDPNQGAFYKNDLISSNLIVGNNLWNEGYKLIYYANAVLEGLNSSTAISDSNRTQLIGEAKFIRAFCHFYLVNLFGDIPLITTTNYQLNAIAVRTPAHNVYVQIISDLKDAQSKMSPDYSFSYGERVRPNKWTAAALLARVYLYLQDWTNASIEATSIINNTSLYNLSPNLNTVFLANSEETIWQLMPVQPGFNTQEGKTFILTDAPQYVAITPDLLNAFESGDNRKADWLDSFTTNGLTYYFAYKYKVKASADLTEYSTVFRLSEQYLIRAEAEAQQNDLTNAAVDLNIIRSRAGLLNSTALSQSDLLAAISHERQIELFSEWGNRWFDLKRTHFADSVLGPIKGPGWQANDTLYPIPREEINKDPRLTQNQGY